jgi:hypothetical protein
VLESLAEAHLLSAHRYGRHNDVRFRMPNLVFVYAREQLAAHERASDRRAALNRLLDAWLGLIDRSRLARSGDENDLPPMGVSPQWPLTRHVVARLSIDPLTWYDNERHALIATVRQACEAGAHEVACAMALASTDFFGARRHWADWRLTHKVALKAARRAGDPACEAALLRSLGDLSALDAPARREPRIGRYIDATA